MKHKIYKRYRTRKKGGQRYWVGRKPKKIHAFMRQDPQELIAYKRFGKQNLKQLPRLGEGSDREVYALGNDKVVKIAKTPRGLAQNEQERGLSDYFLPDDKKLNVFETGKDYVIAERAERNDKKLRQFLKPLQEFNTTDFKNKTGDLQDTMDKLGLSDYLNYGLAWDDFKAARNWGLVKGNPSLIDGGALNKSTLGGFHKSVDPKGDLRITLGMRPEIDPSYKQEWDEIKRERRKFR